MNQHFYCIFTGGFLCHDWQISVSQCTIFANLNKIWKHLRQLIDVKFTPVKYSSLHRNLVCELNAHIKSMGSVQIHFEAWGNNLSCNTCLLCPEKMSLKKLCFEVFFCQGRA